MEMAINWWLIIDVSVCVFFFGALWYSVFFGKTWGKIMGFDSSKISKAEMSKIQKQMTKFYVLEFFVTFITMFILYMNIKWQLVTGTQGLWFAFFIWLGYVMPVIVSCVIWGNTEKKWWFKQIMISLSYRLVTMLAAGYVFSSF